MSGFSPTVDSATPKSADSVGVRRVAVAYSGGRDSTALLHAAIAGSAGIAEVVALHVHHGLSANADSWRAHCEAQCNRLKRTGRRIEFVAHSVSGRPAKGQSVEEWARQVRYRALREMALAHGASVVMLAHHQRDQAETMMLQALRGAGVAGLAGMPCSVERDGVTWLRPWLDRPRTEIDAYVRRHRLKHIEDDTNVDVRFARNRLRLQVWPGLVDAFENAEASLATAARWAQQAGAILAEVAQTDLDAIETDGGLQVSRWLTLSLPRRSNVLRAWIKLRHHASAPASLIERMLDELPLKRIARWPLGDAEIRVHRGVLRLAARARLPSLAPDVFLDIRRAGTYAPRGWGGKLRVERVSHDGVPLAWLGRLELRARRGGEQFQAGIGRPPRSLKKQFQDAGVATWDRHGPLVYSGGQLVFVPGLGLDARVIGFVGQPLVRLHWLPDDATADAGPQRPRS